MIEMNIKSKLNNIILIGVLAFVVSSCGITFVPQVTPEERNFMRERKIEKHVEKNLYPKKSYSSLGFSSWTVYKTDAHLKLDSLYGVKYQLEQERKFSELKNSGIKDSINIWRNIAASRNDELRFEVEHIFSIEQYDSIEVFHDYFLLDQSDSIFAHSPLYSYRIHPSLRRIHLKYLFDLHFMTEADWDISQKEYDFIQFFKEREIDLIWEKDQQKFIHHTLRLMLVAQIINSLDFVDLSKFFIFEHLKTKEGVDDVIEFKELEVMTLDDQVIGYQRIFTWADKQDRFMKSKITYNPYLQIEEVVEIKD